MIQSRVWAGLAALLLSLPAASALSGVPLATVKNGTYAGLHLPAFEQDVFLGIPYAQSTAGQNRFRIPQALNTTWNGTRTAQAYGPACPDDDASDYGLPGGMDEDCLSINIVRPTAAGNRSLPVLLWIHGGSYQVGTSGLESYNLTYIVQKSEDIGMPIVAASINYRKGNWGMLYSREIQGTGNANLSLRDMRKALAWISENIAAFGGDKDKVTIWGESAGSFAIGQLLMTYGGRTDGLFHQSIQESGSAATAWYNGSDWYQPFYDKIVSNVNCSGAVDTLACLRTVPYDTLYPFMFDNVAYPVVDGDIMPNFPTQLLAEGRFAHVPHLYGTNSDEGTANGPSGINTDADLKKYIVNETGWGFTNEMADKIMSIYPDDPAQGVPINTGSERFADLGWQYKRAAAITGDVFYHGPRLNDARHYSLYSPTYIYRFNQRPWENYTNATWTDTTGSLLPAWEGVAHFSEVAFVFNNPNNVGPWPDYDALSSRMSSMWIKFVNDGDPGDGWPKYSDGSNGFNRVFQAKGDYFEEDTYRLEGRNYLTSLARRRHV